MSDSNQPSSSVEVPAHEESVHEESVDEESVDEESVDKEFVDKQPSSLISCDINPERNIIPENPLNPTRWGLRKYSVDERETETQPKSSKSHFTQPLHKQVIKENTRPTSSNVSDTSSISSDSRSDSFTETPVLKRPVRKPRIIFDQLRNIKMELKPKDLISAIPLFDGSKKEIKNFINICNLYDSQLKAEDKPLLLTIIKTKIIGEALTILQPLDTHKTWQELSKAISSKLVGTPSYDVAHQNLATSTQGKNETIEQFANNIRKKLSTLNNASKSISENVNDITILNKTHEILAKNTFQENINDFKIRLIVIAAKCSSLEDAITLAIQREILSNSLNIKHCSFCKTSGHTFDECLKKSNASQQNKGFSRNQNTNESSNFFNPRNYSNNSRPSTSRQFNNNFVPRNNFQNNFNPQFNRQNNYPNQNNFNPQFNRQTNYPNQSHFNPQFNRQIDYSNNTPTRNYYTGQSQSPPTRNNNNSNQNRPNNNNIHQFNSNRRNVRILQEELPTLASIIASENNESKNE